MKRRFGLLTVAWTLLGLLAISATLFWLGSRERASRPSAFSYEPSGVAAFVQLLREAGYRIEIDRRSKPRLKTGDLALGFIVDRSNPWSDGEASPEEPAEKALRLHVESGGRALLFQIPQDFSEATKNARGGPRTLRFDLTLDAQNGRPPSSVTNGGYASAIDPLRGIRSGHSPFSVVQTSSEEPFFNIYGVESGLLADVLDGTGATNRFLDQEQNAEVFLWTLELMNPGKGTIVLLESLASDPVDPGLLGALGSWAAAAWWQFVLALVVIAYTLGRRFGLPETVRSRQRSGRELIDAYADTMRRARRADVALQKIVHEVDRELRRKYNIAPDLPPNRRNAVLPGDLGTVLTEAEVMSRQKPNDFAATRMLFALEDELAKLRGEPVKRRRRRR